MAANDRGQDMDEDPPAPKRKRKEWLKTGKVPRSTLMRWNRQGEVEDEPNEEEQDSYETMSSSNSDTETSGDELSNDEQEGAGGDGNNSEAEGDNENEVHEEGDNENEEGGNENEEHEEGANGNEEGGNENEEHEEGANHEDNIEEVVQLLRRFQFEPDPLYGGTKKTSGEAIVKLMKLFSKHTMTKSCLQDLIKFVHWALPDNNSFPSSYYFLSLSLKPFIPPETNIKHRCCESCGLYQGKWSEGAQPCNACQSTKSVMFHEFHLPTVIKYLFEMRNLADAIDSYTSKQGADITNSEEYKRVKENFPGQYDLLLQFNFDGVQVFNSSTGQMWPTIFNICEVAPEDRDKYAMVTGLWYAKKKPKANSYLLPFAQSLLELSTEGVTWTHPRTKEIHISKVCAPLVSVDAPARAMAQNVHQYNGEYSCNVCEEEGMELPLTRRSRKRIFPFPEEPAPLRTKQSMKEAATRAENDNIIVKGVKGSSILEIIPECDTAKGVNLDYMHLVLLGIVRAFFVMWFTQSGTDWYIGKKAKRVTAYLQSIKRTYETTRCPSDIKTWKLYKASTWRTWLLFVSLPALKGILKEKYLQHWTYLVVGISILLQENISATERALSENLLTTFVRDTQELYGYSAMSYNLHGLLHLPLIVKRWGGLWGISLFTYENVNGILTRLLHGTNRITTELSNTLNLIIATNTLSYLMHHDQNLEAPNQLKLLSRRKTSDIPAEGRQALIATFPENTQIKIFARAEIRRKTYTSEIYSAENTTDNKTICFKNENVKGYGVVLCYAECDGNQYVMIHELSMDPERAFKIDEIDFVVNHIIPVKSSDTIIVLPLTVISHKVLKVHNFLCEDLNNFEQKL